MELHDIYTVLRFKREGIIFSNVDYVDIEEQRLALEMQAKAEVK